MALEVFFFFLNLWDEVKVDRFDVEYRMVFSESWEIALKVGIHV